MPTPRLLPALLIALALAGCGRPAASGVPATSAEVGSVEAQAFTLPWLHPSQISQPNDPALPEDALKSKAGGPNVDIVNFSKVNDRLYRGGLPSKDNLAGLKALGVKTDITLMGEVPVYDTVIVAREKMWAKDVGVKFVQIKVPTGKIPLTPKISNTYSDAFLKVALDPANQPCFVHCLHGRDRTGTMVATYRITQDHLTNQQAFEEMKTFGFNKDHYPALASFVLNFQPSAK
ncbi:MAG: protein tyrosine/serine phosphatase [Cyanobacteria bacterium RYN_339]|nr:protein tyrosine/serine phosphatase [Cyanobacteria bacterium RYN_339]